MVTNIGLDEDGLPYIEEGANDGEVSIIGDRVSITRVAARAVAFTLERSIDGGVTWEPVLAETISGNGANLVDWESLSYGDTIYRAVAFTVEGATASSEITVEARSRALWLSAGLGFSLVGRLWLNPKVQHTQSRQRALKQYAGRSQPVTVNGEGISNVLSVTGNVWDDEDAMADVERLKALAQDDAPLYLFRDPDGRRIYGAIGPITEQRLASSTTPEGWNGYWQYSFTFTEATS